MDLVRQPFFFFFFFCDVLLNVVSPVYLLNHAGFFESYKYKM